MTQIKKLFNRIDPGIWVALAISLLAIWPFLSIPSLPEGTDAELHIFRLHELSLLVRGGELYGRWAPNFYHGYGYPIFNYYAPLTYYLGLFVELMPNLDAVDGVKATFVLGMLLGAVGMYGFARDNWGRRAGYAATAVFLYAPYIQYIDPHVRGVLPESFSFGVFPMALWSLDRLRRGGGRWAWVTAVLFTAAVILSHNLMGLLFFGILVAWAVWQFASGQMGKYASGQAADGENLQTRKLANLQTHVFAALFLGLGLAAFFWLPVFLERDAVNLNTLLGAGDNYDFRTHFLSWREMLSFSKWLDWGATQPDFVFNLGAPQWVLGGLGLVMLALRRVKQATHLAFFALALAVLLFLMFPVSTFVWESLPFLPFFQFPWRLLGGTAVMLAVLAGAGVGAIEHADLARSPAHPPTRPPAWITAVLVVLPLLFALPLTQPTPWPDFGDVFTGRMSEIEHKGRWLGTTSTADYVPTTVDAVPGRQGSVVVPLYSDEPPDWVNWTAMPEGTAVTIDTITPLRVRYTVDAPKKFRLRLFLFDFPGWEVRIDGGPVETELGRPEGFIVIPVPKGHHEVEVEFKDTPPRSLAWAITAVSLTLTLLWGWRLSPDALRFTSHVSRFTFHDRVTLGVVLGITALTLLILQPTDWLHYDSADFAAEAADTAVFVNFGDQIALIGYDVSTERASPGDVVDVTAYWQAERPLDINYQVFIHLLRADGPLVAQSDKLNPGEFPSRQWPLEKYVRDEHHLQLPPDLPPGEYVISVGLWVQTEGWRLPVFDENGRQIGDNFVLSSLEVR
ncbi:MAG: hypothetical protein GY803_12665 [Chloroflexi bacterium]|nr:hypothetical protein [Chloroflexota bacterium]